MVPFPSGMASSQVLIGAASLRLSDGSGSRDVCARRNDDRRPQRTREYRGMVIFIFIYRDLLQERTAGARAS